MDPIGWFGRLAGIGIIDAVGSLDNRGAVVNGAAVFVSHTSELASWPQPRSCVDAALDAVAAAGMVAVDMRHFPATDATPAHVCRQRVQKTQVYVAVIGFRYGSLVPGLDVSYTELEFDTATEAGLPRVVLLMRDPPDDESLVDTDRGRIDRFRRRLTHESGLTVAWFDTADKVQYLIYQGLTELRHPVAGAAGPGWVMAGPEGPEGARGHFTSRGRGQRSYARGGDLFRGRTAALSAVLGWLHAEPAPGRVLVVTGQPGAGKSAVVARAVLEAERAELEAGHTGPAGLAFHARDATLADFLTAVASLAGTRVADSVPGMIDRLRAVPTAGPLRVVVDALDEAASDTDRGRLIEALTDLAALPQARVVVATRSLAVGNRFAPGTVLHALGVWSATATNLVDLDVDRFFDPDGLRAFAAALLRPTPASWATRSSSSTPAPYGRWRWVG